MCVCGVCETGIGPRTAERLKALGVLSVTDLQLFPLRQLVCEFGEVNAKRIQSLACGVDLSPVTPAGPPQVTHTHTQTVSLDETDLMIILHWYINSLK